MDNSKLQLFPVRFETVDGNVYKTMIPAYSNGGAENKVLDLQHDNIRRVLAFSPDKSDTETAEQLYPNAQWIDCMEIAILATIECDLDEDDEPVPTYTIEEHVGPDGPVRIHGYWDEDEAINDFHHFNADKNVFAAYLYDNTQGYPNLIASVVSSVTHKAV